MSQIPPNPFRPFERQVEETQVGRTKFPPPLSIVEPIVGHCITYTYPPHANPLCPGGLLYKLRMCYYGAAPAIITAFCQMPEPNPYVPPDVVFPPFKRPTPPPDLLAGPIQKPLKPSPPIGPFGPTIQPSPYLIPIPIGY